MHGIDIEPSGKMPASQLCTSDEPATFSEERTCFMLAGTATDPSMQLTLYHDERSRSVRVRTVLEEIDTPYELVHVSLAENEHKQASHRARHPLAQLPVLEIDGRSMIESVGICMWLADSFPEARLAPPPTSPERADYCQWCAFVLGSLEPAIEAEMVRRKHPEIVGHVPTLANTMAALIEPLRERRTLLPSGISVADLTIASTLHVISGHGVELPGELAAFLETIRGRPAFARGHA